MRRSRPIRILHLITTFVDVGGAERALYNLVSRLDRERFEPVVMCLVDYGRDWRLWEQLETSGIPVYCVGIQPTRPPPVSAAWRLIKMVREINPNLIQGWMAHGNLAGAFAATFLPSRVPLLWSIRGAFDLERDKKLTVAVIRMGALLSARPDRILYVSRAGAKEHEAIGYRADRRLVIPNGFDHEQLLPDTEARASVRAELGLTEETPLIGLIARYHPVKDHANFLDAASLLTAQGFNAHFLLAGYGVDYSNKELSSKVSTLNLRERVRLLGNRGDIIRVTAALDVASSTSWGEGFSNVIGEAMSCGVPCVVTDVGDSAWIVGETGWVVPPRDPVALSEAWGAALRMGRGARTELGERARARIATNFSLDETIRQYEELYTEVIDSTR